MKLREIKMHDPAILQTNLTVQEAAAILLQKNVNCAPVIDEKGNIEGLLTNRHILNLVSQKGNLSTLITDIMSNRVVIGHPDDKIEDYLNPSLEYLLVVDEKKIMGIITHKDLGNKFFRSYTKIFCELEAIINSIHNLIIAVDRNGFVEVTNDAFQRFLGMTAEELKRIHVKNIAPESGLEEVVKSGKAELAQKIMVFNRWFLTNRFPIKKDGKIIGAVAVLQDITELDNIAEELEHYKSLNNELDMIINSSFDGILVADGNGIVLRTNEAFEKVTGVKREDILGRSMIDFEKEGLVSESAVKLALERKESVTISHQTNKSGRLHLTTANLCFGDHGNVYRVVCNVRDITELNDLRRRIEEIKGLSQHYESELRALRLQYSGSDKIIFKSEKMKSLLGMVVKLAHYDSTILITGETGTGKELIAETIHNNSSRCNEPYIKVNCGAIPENLLESELFGYDYGAFTGAKKQGKAGQFQLANGGTIFLDEIGDLPFNMQVKLLRVIQNKEITRVGSEKSIPIDVRFIAGTNRNLLDLVGKKEFREDLYYRLNVVPIHVPPLRERKEDIPILINHFINLFNKKYDQNKRVSSEVIDRLMDYDWLGNVRELENLIERLMVTSTGYLINRKDLPSYFNQTSVKPSGVLVSGIVPLQDAIESLEKQLLQKAYSGNLTTRQMAKLLQVDHSTIVKKAAKYGISKHNFKK